MIYTIGYSNRSLPEFLEQLERNRITQLIDVRSKPWSRNASFSATEIQRWAPKAGVMYRQRGEILGGRENISLDDPRYVGALEEVLCSASREPLALMCAEGDPEFCHRTWDIAASMILRWGVVARSIRRSGRVEDATQSLARVQTSTLSPPVAARVSQILRPNFGQIVPGCAF